MFLVCDSYLYAGKHIDLAGRIAEIVPHLDSVERVVGMGIMGLGGLVSAIGGVLFIIVVIRALFAPARSRRKPAQPT